MIVWGESHWRRILDSTSFAVLKRKYGDVYRGGWKIGCFFAVEI